MRLKISKYMTKKVMAGAVAILLGLGILLGDKARLSHYMDQATHYISQYIGDAEEEGNPE